MLSTKTSTFKTDANWTLPFPFFPSPFFNTLVFTKDKANFNGNFELLFLFSSSQKQMETHVYILCIWVCCTFFCLDEKFMKSGTKLHTLLPQKVKWFLFSDDKYIVDHSSEIKSLMLDEILHWKYFSNVLSLFGIRKVK